MPTPLAEHVLGVFQLHNGELGPVAIMKCPMPRPCIATSTVFQCLNLDKGLEVGALIWGASKSSKTTEHCLQTLLRVPTPPPPPECTADYAGVL